MKRILVLGIIGIVLSGLTACLFSLWPVRSEVLNFWEVVTGQYVIRYDTSVDGTDDERIGITRILLEKNARIEKQTENAMRVISARREEKRKDEAEKRELAESMRVSDAWTLLGGDPGESCSRPTYAGEVAVRGWYVLETAYGEKDWLLRLVPEDRDKIFVAGYDQSFRIADASVALEQRLRRASEKYPIEVTLRGMMYYCEGPPIVSVDPPGSNGIVFK